MCANTVVPLLFTLDELELCCVSVQSDTMHDLDSFNRPAFEQRLRLIDSLLYHLPQGRAKKLDLRPLLRDLFNVNPPDLVD